MIKVLAIACVAVPAMVVSAIAQQPAIKRTVLRSIDYPAGYTTVTAIVELAPGTQRGPSHPSGDRQRLCHGRRLRPQGRRETRPDVQGGQIHTRRRPIRPMMVARCPVLNC